MLKTGRAEMAIADLAYHLGEGRVLKTCREEGRRDRGAYHLGEGRVLKTRHRPL